MDGLAEQDINLDRFLTVRETLIYHGGYFGMERDEAEERAEEMIERFDLRPRRHARPKLSGGSAAVCCWPARSCTARAS